ncbi:MAG TPA: fasciclin domain-containing protein [Candidatus Hydrogenedentes bacterium]|nr:fasciclin domain-containing protein [Candidatus Hydrogenedentota bacterium]HRK32970.1 fasciclin domain-containing protein [Candidatus Hydrogenedentota bacterium]
MKLSRVKWAFAAVAAAAVSVGATAAPKASIAETATKAGTFTTLLKAAGVAGLSETLGAAGSLTVFAPSDDAFAKLPAGTVSALLENPDRLRTVLLYHIVDGTVDSGAVAGLKTAKSLMGQSLNIDSSDGVKINAAKVTKADILCSNGVIHVVDSVLLPKDIVDLAASADGFGTLVAAVKAAGLVETLKGDGPFTVFAPTDAAFKKLPAGTVESLLKPENKEKLVAILTYHVVPGLVTAEQVASVTTAKTVNGASLAVKVEKDDKGALKGVKIGSAGVAQTDLMASNGVIHVIDTVLVP